MAKGAITVDASGTPVKVTNPEKVYFPESGYTKGEVVDYFLSVMDGALRGIYRRPFVLKRFVNGINEEPFFQKRAPAQRPEHVTTSHITFPSGRTADLTVCDEPADLIWAANLGCIDLNPWPVRADDVDHPDELRIDLDPTPGIPWDMVRECAMLVKDVLDEHGYVGFPKTSGSRGIHILVRIEPKWGFTEVRRSVLAIGRECERRAPTLATTKWWKEERHGVFIDYNQNARDRTVASAYSIRPLPDARVSYPLTWHQVPTVEAEAYTMKTVPGLFARDGDAHAGVDDVYHSLGPLLELVERHEKQGMGEAPYPPQFPKAEGEPMRVQPSRKKKAK
jgi:DNA ligase D-like protein (predicted polymerase)